MIYDTSVKDKCCVMCFKIGRSTVVPINDNLISQLGIDSEETIFEEELTDEGILLRIRRISS